MTVDELIDVLVTLDLDLPVTIGQMQDGEAVDMQAGVVIWWSAPVAWRDSEACSVSLVPLRQIEDYVKKTARMTERVA